MQSTRRITRAVLTRALLGAVGALVLAPLVEAAPKRVKVPIPRPRPSLAAAPIRLAPPLSLVPTALASIGPIAAHAAVAPSEPLPVAPTLTTSAADLAAVKRAIALIHSRKQSEAATAMGSISDPLARKLVEWLILRSDENHGAGFERYAAFVRQNPSWPSVALLRKRAEAALWDDKRDAATVYAYFQTTRPLTAKGHLAYARALVARGDAAAAAHHVREAWHRDALTPALETTVLESFSGMLRPEDHKSRMLRRLYAEDAGAGLRAAQHLGGPDLAIAKAWAAVIRKAGDAETLLDAVPANARTDAGYVFSLARFLRHKDKIAQAGQVMLGAPRDAAQILDADQWWIERRLIARKLLDIGDARTAYLVARDAVTPKKGNYRVDHEFTAGWIALRFLKDPATALTHFNRIARGTTNPTALARAGYWRGRAAEALGRSRDARGYYAEAGRISTSYYGQLARARLGEPEIALASPPAPSAEQRATLGRLEVVRAVELLYAVGERDPVISIVAEFAHRGQDVGTLTMLADIAQRNQDARALLLIGKGGLDHGHAFDHYAFPTIGVPHYQAIGPHIDPSVVYSIVRQESSFNPKDVSGANALGLMQVTPEAGRYVAHKFRVGFDKHRLLNDQAYNVQMGSAELGDLLKDYRGSYILAFAGYNAGRGRVRDWIARYGDPREPGVDPVDWVERIPFAETRNYVERVMENMQVYRVRFGGGRNLLIEADLRRGGTSGSGN